MMRSLTCDILIIGGGGGALRAALTLAEEYPRLRVLLATKGKLGQSGVTALACSDRMAFHATLPHTPPEGAENWRQHAADIYRLGGQVSDYPLAEVLARHSAEALDYLVRLGVPFKRRADGLIDQFVTDGSLWPRACYTGPRTAIHIAERLVNRFRELKIPLLEHCMAVDLLKTGEQICGALLYDREGWLTVGAGAVILATGGAGLLYRHNVYPAGMTGDGYAMALRAGAELVNMEFVQLGVASLKTKLNCSGSMFRALPRLVNDLGKEFLEDYLPAGLSPGERLSLVFRKGASWPVSYEHDTRIVDIAVYREIRAGRKVYLDFNRNPTGFDLNLLPERDQERYQSEIGENTEDPSPHREGSPLDRLQEINSATVEWLREQGIDLDAGEVIEVAVCGQHFQGGVKINALGETGVPGLFAVGETAGGQHGANRPGGNALLDSQVFGAIAARAAVDGSTRGSEPDLRAAADIAGKLQARYGSGKTGAAAWRTCLQELVMDYAGVIRTASGLEEGLAGLDRLRAESFTAGAEGFLYALENRNLTLVAEALLRAALVRDESRGPHLRFDSEISLEPRPRRDPEWQKYIVLSLKGEKLETELRSPERDAVD